MKFFLITFLLILNLTVYSQQTAFIPFSEINADSVLSKIELKDKRIIILGEPVHGGEEIIEFNQKIINSLVTNHGFTTLIMESDFFALWNYQNKKDSFNIQNNIHGVYSNARAFEPIIELIDSNKLKILGFDSRHHGAISKLYLTDFLRNKLEKYGIEHELNFHQKTTHLLEKEFLVKWEGSDFDKYDSSINSYLSIVKDSTLFLYQELMNLKNFASQVRIEKESTEGYVNYREKAMIQNVKWLLENLKGEKIIVLGANFHVQKGIGSLTNSNQRNIGDFIQENYSPEALSIFPIVYQGKVRQYDNQLVKLKSKRRTVPHYLGKKTQSDFVLIDLNKLGADYKIYHRNDKNTPLTYGDYLFYIRKVHPSLVRNNL